MPRKPSQTLTEAELRIMQVLWRKGPATVQQILDALPVAPALAYNSILTIIRILEKKGYVAHSKDGRAHVYQPLVEQEEASRSEISRLVSRFFRDSHEDLVLNILGERGIDPAELARLRAMLEAAAPRTPAPAPAGEALVLGLDDALEDDLGLEKGEVQ